jgi:hypothetical protein
LPWGITPFFGSYNTYHTLAEKATDFFKASSLFSAYQNLKGYMAGPIYPATQGIQLAL